MRRLLVELWVNGCDTPHLEKKRLQDLEPEFLVDCVILSNKRGIVLGAGAADEDDETRVREGFCEKYHRHD